MLVATLGEIRPRRASASPGPGSWSSTPWSSCWPRSVRGFST